MATAPVKSPLHNFPPTFLKWGSKSPHHHRCRRNSPFDSPPPPPPEDIDSSKAAEPVPEREREPEVEGEKPWNLRPRRTPTSVSSSMAKISSTEAAENLPKSMRLRGFDYQGGGDKRFWVALSKDEIEEDIYAFTASKPSRRPKKRPKNVQKQLDNMFPGLRLVGFSADTYRGLYVPPDVDMSVTANSLFAGLPNALGRRW